MNLPEGYKIETWHQVWERNENGRRVKLLACIENENTAKAFAIGKDSWGGDAEVSSVTILVDPDRKNGRVLEPDPISLMSESDANVSIREKALAKLDPKERAILGLE